jgi:hypothetical protein
MIPWPHARIAGARRTIYHVDLAAGRIPGMPRWNGAFDCVEWSPNRYPRFVLNSAYDACGTQVRLDGIFTGSFA